MDFLPEFQEAGYIDETQIAVPLKGGDFFYELGSGQVFTGPEDDVAYVSLPIEGFDFEDPRTDEPVSYREVFGMGALELMAGIINADTLSARKGTRPMFRIVYSNLVNGDAITFTHLGKDIYQERGDFRVSLVDIMREPHSLAPAYSYVKTHLDATEDLDVIGCGDAVRENPDILVEKVNEFYQIWDDKVTLF